MFARRIVAKHVTKTTAMAMLGATAILSVLQILFTYLGELGSLKEGYGAWDALRYVLWGAPQYLYEILPIAALIGSVLGLGTLASNSELIVMRSVGVSLWRIVGWVIRSALILVVLSFALSEWVIPYTNEQAKGVKSHRTAAELGEVRGAWIFATAAAAAALVSPNTRTVPLSSISIAALVSSVIARIVAPPLPITSRILSGLMLITWNVGACIEISGRAREITWFISFNMCIRPA